jgi:hypothetical protein
MDQKFEIQMNEETSAGDDQPEIENLLLLMRLVIGGTAEGVDELLQRLKEQQQKLEQTSAANTTVFPEDETGLEQLRYALIGLLFETPEFAANSLTAVGRTAHKASNLVSRVTGPLFNSRLMRPFQRRYETVVAQSETKLERLAGAGRLEEQTGRLLARETATEVVDELLAYLAHKPEVRQLVQQQAVGRTEELVDQLRQRTAATDERLARLAGGILGRSSSSPSPPPVIDVPAEALPPDQAKPGADQ